MEKIYILNSLPLSSLQFTNFKFPESSSIKTLFVKISPISIKETKKLIKNKKIISYIGHEGTASLLTNILKTKIPFNRDMARLKAGNEAIVVTLKKRTKLGEDKTILKKDDLNFFYIYIPTDQWGYFTI